MICKKRVKEIGIAIVVALSWSNKSSTNVLSSDPKPHNALTFNNFFPPQKAQVLQASKASAKTSKASRSAKGNKALKSASFSMNASAKASKAVIV
jgi:hypothetical protein